MVNFSADSLSAKVSMIEVRFVSFHRLLRIFALSACSTIRELRRPPAQTAHPFPFSNQLYPIFTTIRWINFMDPHAAGFFRDFCRLLMLLPVANQSFLFY